MEQETQNKERAKQKRREKERQREIACDAAEVSPSIPQPLFGRLGFTQLKNTIH
jgi:hypothetical protein